MVFSFFGGGVLKRIRCEKRMYKKSRKRKQTTQSVMDSQTNYNKKMKLSRNKQRSFKVEDYVTIKIDKVDKTTPLHPN